jgi:hypothetical protein
LRPAVGRPAIRLVQRLPGSIAARAEGSTVMPPMGAVTAVRPRCRAGSGDRYQPMAKPAASAATVMSQPTARPGRLGRRMLARAFP